MKNISKYLIIFISLPCFLILVNIFHSTKSNFISNQPKISYSFKIIGKKGRKKGCFIKPRSLTLSEKNIYIVDMTGRIQVFDKNNLSFMFSFKTPAIKYGKPTGLFFYKKKNILYVADTHYHRILGYDEKGNLIFKFGKYGFEPGKFLFVTDIVIDNKGNIYISQYGDALKGGDRIQKFDSNWHFIKMWGKTGDKLGEFQRPMDLALDPLSQTLLVADACNHRIQRFTLDGKFIEVIGEPGIFKGQLSYPYGLCIDKRGNIYVSEFGNNRIQKFDKKGISLGIIGIAGSDEGMFANPWDIEIENNLLYIVDTLNHRVQICSCKLFN